MKLIPYPKSADTEELKAKSVLRLEWLIAKEAPEELIEMEKQHLSRLMGGEVGEA